MADDTDVTGVVMYRAWTMGGPSGVFHSALGDTPRKAATALMGKLARTTRPRVKRLCIVKGEMDGGVFDYKPMTCARRVIAATDEAVAQLPDGEG